MNSSGQSKARRVIFLVRRLATGGAEVQLLNLVGGLDKRRFAPVVVAAYAGGDLESPFRRIAGVRVVSLGKRSTFDLAALLRLSAVVRRLQPDVAHGYMALGNLMAVAAGFWSRRTRVVLGIRGSNNRVAGHDTMPLRAAFRFNAWVSRRAALAICNSESGRNYFACSGYRPRRWRVIPNGIDVARFAPDPQARARVRRELGLGAEHRLIGMMARLDPIKGHAIFLAAAAAAARQNPSLRFVCVGSGPESLARALGELAASLGLDGKLTWAGHRADAPAWYNAFDIGVMASPAGEGFPNAIAEAMACGTPCVATAVGDAAVILDGLGVVVTPADAGGMSAGILALLARREREPDLQAACRERIAAHFSVERCVRETEAAMLALP